jgi:2-polyprenyl-3-methyl-5-hydroxy-6-metoxy-1,4-benzoquinol methylase
VDTDEIAALGPWFYDFELPGGVRTNPGLPEHLRSMHADREAMLRAAVQIAFPAGLSGVRALDVGCHEGYFTQRLLAMGVGSAVGVDLREQNIRKAGLAAGAMGVEGARWLVGDAEDLGMVLGGERFGLSVAYGLIYHCENPVRVLRQIAAVTDHAIVIETQLASESVETELEWGRHGYRLKVQGVFAVVDESVLHLVNAETGATPLALCPSEGAVRAVLTHCGFGRITRVPADPVANEQLVRGRRGVFLAQRTEPAP